MKNPIEKKFSASIFLSAIFSLLTTTSCIVDMNLPVIRYEGPETKGEQGSGELSLTLERTPKVTLVEDTSIVPPNTNSPEFEPGSGAIGLKTEFGVIKFIDVYARAAYQSPIVGGLKFQILGASEAESKQGNFSLAVLSGGGWYRDSDTDTSTNPSAKHVAHQFIFESGIISGYRALDFLLPYLAVYYARHFIDGRITQGTSVYKFGEDENQWSLNLGAQFNANRFMGKVEIAQAFSEYMSKSKAQLVGGLSLGFYW